MEPLDRDHSLDGRCGLGVVAGAAERDADVSPGRFSADFPPLGFL